MDPLRVKKRRLEEELLLLQNKEKKSSRDKERRQRNGKTLPPKTKGKPTSCKTGSLDHFLKQIEGKVQSSSNSVGQVQGDDAASDHPKVGEESRQSRGKPAVQVQGGEASGRQQGEEESSQSSGNSAGQGQEDEASGRPQSEGQSGSSSSTQADESFLAWDLDSQRTVQTFSCTLL